MRFLNKKSGQFVTVYPKHTQAVCALLRSQDYLVVNDAIWQEADHPRDTDGKFTNAGGGAEAPTTGKVVAPITTPATPALLSKPKAPTAKNNKKHLENVFNTKDLEPLKPEARIKLESIYEKASEVKDKFDAIGEKITKEVNGEYKKPPLKGTKRAVEKIMYDYNGDPTKIKDLVRSTIEVKTIAEAQGAVDKIKKEYKVLDSGFRDLLNPNVKSNLFGYRDAKMNVEIDGIIAEIQVNIPEMLEAKSRNHDKYEIISKMDRIVSSENRTFTDEEAQKRNKLIQEMEDDYDSVWNELTKSMKPS